MYKSIRFLSQQLVKAREQVFESKKVVRKDFLKIVVLGGVAQLVLCLIVEEFGIPTPDICYDGRKLMSPEFASYVQNGKYSGYDMSLSSAIRSYKISEGHVARTQNQRNFTSTSYSKSD